MSSGSTPGESPKAQVNGSTFRRRLAASPQVNPILPWLNWSKLSKVLPASWHHPASDHPAGESPTDQAGADV